MRKHIVVVSVLCLLLGVVGAAVSEALNVEVAVAPSTLILNVTQGDAVTVHAAIPFSQVVGDPTLTMPDGSEVIAEETWADNRGDLVARFDEATVEAGVTVGTQTLVLNGNTEDGTFTGSGTVQVIVWKGRR